MVFLKYDRLVPVRHIRFSLLLLQAVAVFAFCPDQVNASSTSRASLNDFRQPIVNEAVKYYTIRAASENEIRDQIRQKGIESGDGLIYDSATSWRLNCSHTCEAEPSGCTCCSPAVVLEIIYRYPKWVPPPGTSSRLLEKWNTYVHNLTIHENGHRDIAIHQANELSQDLYQISPAASCGELERKVRALNRVHVNKAKILQDEYDTKTGHGLSQGAIFK